MWRLSFAILFVESIHNMVSPRSIEELIQELDQPNLTGWKLFAQTSDVKVYRQADEDVKLYLYLKNTFFIFIEINTI